MAYIYKLNFPNDSRVYIGQTTRTPEIRLKKHISDLNKGTRHSKQLISAFPKCGIPTVEIVEECQASLLDSREVYWIDKFNSYHAGFNGTTGGKSIQPGENHPRALYTNEDYSCAVHFLAYTDYSYSEISDEIGVNRGVLINIKAGLTAGFVKEEYPEAYAIMINKVRPSGTPIRKDYPRIVSPDNTVYEVTNGITVFAKEHNIDSNHLGDVLRGNRKVVQGWKLYKENTNANN